MDPSYQFPDDVMVDPSLLASDNYAWDTIEAISEQNLVDFYIPQSFVTFLEQEGYQAYLADRADRPPILNYYSYQADVPNLSDVQVSEGLSTFHAGEFDSRYENLYRSLSQTLPYSRKRPPIEEISYDSGGDLLLDSVFEELVFLMEKSGLVSRIKRVINDAIEAGMSFIETSEQRIDNFANEHMKDREQVKKDLVKRIGKWVAVSATGTATGIIGTPLMGVISATSVKYAADATFLFVFDP